MTEHETPATPDEYADYYDEQADRLNQSIENLAVEIDTGGPDVAKRYRDVIVDLRAGRVRLAEFADRIRKSSDDAWQEVGGTAERALAGLESGIATARADLHAELAPDIAAYRRAAKTQADAWRAHFDQLKEHAKGAGTKAREALDTLEEAYQRAKPELEKASETTGEALDALKDRVGDLVGHLRKAVRKLNRSLD